MNKSVVVLLLFSCLTFWASAQSEPTPLLLHTRNVLIRAGGMGISGALHGVSETLKFHPGAFFAQHPSAPREFWDVNVSWRNKYRNGDPAQGAKYFGSTTFLAWTTDGYHVTQTGSRLTGAVSLCFPLWKGSGKKVYHYAMEAGGSYLAWTAGFHLTYSAIYGR